MKKRLPIVLAVVVVLGLLITAVRTFVLNNGAVNPDSVTASGTIEATEVQMAFRMAGILAQRPVEEGDSVASGQLIAVLDSREQQARINEASAAVEVARATLQDLERGYRPEEIAQAEAGVREAQVQLNNLRDQAQRSRDIFPTGGVSKDKLDNDTAAANAAAARLRSAQEKLKLLRSGYRSEQIDTARARVAQAEAALATLKVQLDDMSAHAPLAGVITRTHAEVGETVGAGQPVATLAELARPKLRVFIPESLIGRIKLGAAAEVSVDAYPGRKFPGKVTFVSPEAEFTPKNVQTQEERVKQVFAVDVRMDNNDGTLKPGMPADVVIQAPSR